MSSALGVSSLLTLLNAFADECDTSVDRMIDDALVRCGAAQPALDVYSRTLPGNAILLTKRELAEVTNLPRKAKKALAAQGLVLSRSKAGRRLAREQERARRKRCR